METTKSIAIYQTKEGAVTVNTHLYNETLWLTQSQIADLFDKDRTVITKHINKILAEEELDNSVCAKFAHTAADGKIYHTNYYNLDMIISVGYRVNSKQATEFRRWATRILKEYLLQGYSVNKALLSDKLISDLKNTISLLSNTLTNENLVSDLGKEVLNIVTNYAKTWNLLLSYDENTLAESKVENKELSEKLSYQAAIESIKVLKKDLAEKGEATTFFGQERDKALDSIIGSLYQTFDGISLYQTNNERAAHLLYLIIKDHPFSDGNKRIACLLFLIYLQKSGYNIGKLDNNTIVAVALMIASSDPSQKDILTQLVVNLLES